MQIYLGAHTLKSSRSKLKCDKCRKRLIKGELFLEINANVDSEFYCEECARKFINDLKESIKLIDVALNTRKTKTSILVCKNCGEEHKRNRGHRNDLNKDNSSYCYECGKMTLFEFKLINKNTRYGVISR